MMDKALTENKGMSIVQRSDLLMSWPGDATGQYALVIDLLGKVLQAPISATNDAIQEALGRMGAASGVDRAYVFRANGPDLLDNTHEWCAPGIDAMIDELQGLPREMVGHWIAALEQGQSVHVADVASLPDGAPEKETLEMQGVQTVLVVPILHDGQFEGFVGYDCVHATRSFMSHEIMLLQAVAGAISSVLYRQVAHQAETASRQRLVTAIESLPDAFALFDADDRLALFNERYRHFYPAIAEQFVPGKPFVDILRAGLARGVYQDAIGREKEWLDKALQRRQHDQSEHEIQLASGRWLRVIETATPDGGRVGMRVDITALKNAERRLEDIISAADAGTWEWNILTGENRINARWASILGYSKDEIGPITARFWQEFLHPDDTAKVRAEIDAVFKRQADQFAHEFRMRHKDGRWVDILSRGRVSRWADDMSPMEMVGVHIDITAQKSAEKRLEDIIRGASVGTWEYEPLTGLNRVNELWAQMLGYTLEDLGTVDHSVWRSMVHPDDIANLDQQHKIAVNRDIDQFENVIRMRHRNGDWVWILSRGQVTRRDRDGMALAIAGIHIDISESRRREEALRKAYDELNNATRERDAANQRFADIAAVSVDWFWETDPDGRFTFVSESFDRATGWSSALLRGKSMADIAKADPTMQASADWESLKNSFKSKKSFEDFVYLIPANAKHDSDIWVRTSGAPYYDLNGVFCGYRGVASDITMLYAAKERAEAANRAKSQFLANMSHEIRTPLNGVLGMAELLTDALTDPAQTQMIATIRESGEGLLNVLNDILDLAKVEAGKMDLELRPFVPRDLANKVEALYSLRAQDKGISFSVLSDSGSTRARIGDAHRLLQVLHNLINNAIKFTHAGEINVSMRARLNEPLEIEVRDTGIGMTQDQAARVFEDFEQADGAVSRRYGGTGLGLSIVRRLVELMGGTISISSEVNKGTIVRLVLSLPETDGLIEKDPAQTTPLPASFPGLRALVADDNATNRMILRAMLGALGVAVTSVENGEQAVETWRAGAFDILLLDISMPGIDGMTALAQIRAKGATNPAIAVTANAMTHQIQEYFTAGFDGYVGKPFRRDDLAREIGRIMGALGVAAQ